jgi:glutamine synthetase
MTNGIQDRMVTVAVTDTNGLLRGQKLAASGLPSLLETGMGMAPAQLALDPTDEILDLPGVTDDSGDFHDSFLKIDASSRRDMPWEKPGDSGLYLAEFTGDAASFCPRNVLRRVMDRAGDMGITAKYGYEQEFTLFNETAQTLRHKGFDDLETATPHPSHDLLIYQSLQSDFYGEIADICEPLGINLGKMHEEIGGGFMEACIGAGTGLDPADQAVLLKNFLRVAAMRRGQSITYMPRWSLEADSQSTHVHLSLLNEKGGPLFWDETKPDNMSETFTHFLGGLQKFLPDMMLIMVPTVNGWRRFAEGTFAPPAYSWGIENRTCAFRVVGHGPKSLRFENRLPGADSNPYLTMAATLSAGLAGITNKIAPSAATKGNGYVPGVGIGDPLVATMQDAIDGLRASEHAADWLSPRFVEAFSATRTAQLAAFEGDDLIAERRRFFELG